MKHYDTSKHFSHNLEFKLDTLPAKRSDRVALHITYPGLLLGFALVVLGIYEMFIRTGGATPDSEAIVPEGEAVAYESFLSPNFFDAAIIILGLWIIASLIVSYIRYKKILFDGKTFTITHRPFLGEKKKLTEKLANYEGVNMRIEFFQFGFINKNKYIIELLHKDPLKTVPLYINTKGKNIHHIWKQYAKLLGKPALLWTNEGMVSRNVEDLDNSVAELVKKGLLKNEYSSKAALPSSVVYTRKGDKTILKVRKIFWDAYNIIAWVGIVFFGGLMVLTGIDHYAVSKLIPSYILSNFYIIGTIGLIASVFVLFRKDKIAIKKHKLVVVHKFMLFSRKKDELAKSEIESIDVRLNPATGRYFLAIVADKKTIIFGKKMPVDDLKWVRAFLINEVVK